MKHAYKGPARLAHRGNVVRAPENTWPAIQEAVFSGAEGVEIDLRKTRDGAVVVAHDAGTGRLTCRERGSAIDRLLGDHDWADLQGLAIPFANRLMPDYRSCPEDEGEMLRLMEEIQRGRSPAHPFAAAEEKDRRAARFLLLEDLIRGLNRGSWRGILELELKDMGLLPLLAPLLERTPYSGRIYLMSGDREIIREIQDFYRNREKPEGLGLAANIRRLDSFWAEEIPKMDLQEVGLNAWEFGREETAYLGSRGIAVFSNLGDTPAWWRELQQAGAAAFKTNYLEEYTNWWRREYDGTV